MDEQYPNAFIGRKETPGDADLAQALGKSKPVWDALIADLASTYEVNIQVWRSYSPKHGWALRLLRKKRTIVWMAPALNCFHVAFILGEKAVKAARECGLPARVLKLLEEAPKYPEGTGLRLLIKNPRDIAAVKKLAAVKLAN